MKEQKEKIALIDADSILYSAFYGNKVVDTVTGEPKKENGKYVIIPKTEEEIMESLDGIFYHIFQEGGFTHYIIFIKGDNTTVDRKAINPRYKATRLETPKEWEFTKNYAISKWKATVINNIEVDDAIRICSLKIKNSHIVAIDKDLLWLKGNNFNWRKSEWSEVDAKQEEEYFSRSLVIGDTVDNICGVHGKGEVYCNKNNITTVSKAFNTYIETYGLQLGVDEFYKNFKCLHILTHSDKYTECPTPIKIDTDNGENNKSRSTTRELYNA